MKRPPALVRAYVRIVGAVLPRLVLGFVFRIFWNLQPRMTVRADCVAVHERARREIVPVGTRSALVYRWGTGAETVLLVHGWRGRASQFAQLIAALESPDRTIIAFDAPGNGDAPGTATDLRDYIAVIRAIAQDSGRLDLIVAHSFGVVGMFVAVREGVRARGLVSIAGNTGITYTFDMFVRMLEVPKRLAALLRRKIERDVFNGDTGFWRRFVSELEPTDHTPLLVVHDRDDHVNAFSESKLIADAHLGQTTELFTSGLGHTRVLSDPTIIAAIVDFANEPARTR